MHGSKRESYENIMFEHLVGLNYNIRKLVPAIFFCFLIYRMRSEQAFGYRITHVDSAILELIQL